LKIYKIFLTLWT